MIAYKLDGYFQAIQFLSLVLGRLFVMFVLVVFHVRFNNFFLSFAQVVTPKLPPCSGNGPGSPSGDMRLLSRTRASSLPVISNTNIDIAKKLTIKRNTCTCKLSGRLTIFFNQIFYINVHFARDRGSRGNLTAKYEFEIIHRRYKSQKIIIVGIDNTMTLTSHNVCTLL